MRKHRVRRLPVVDEDGAPAGILSLADLALAASGNLHMMQARDLARTLAALTTPRRPPNGTTRHPECPPVGSPTLSRAAGHHSQSPVRHHAPDHGSSTDSSGPGGYQ